MRIESKTASLVFTEGDHELRVQYANRGEPYRDGVEFVFDTPSRACSTWVLLDRREVAVLRDKLNEFLGSHHRDE